MPALKRALGLTGGLGSGKSTVLAMFKKLGAVTLDADKIAHRFLKLGSPTYRRILKTFGGSILKKSGGIDRQKLGRRVFTNPRAKRALEHLIHPRVKAEIEKRLGNLKARKTVVVEVPLLFESGLDNLFDRTAVVWCALGEQRERLIRRNHFSQRELRDRMSAQWPLSKKRRLADIVIDNSGSRFHTRKQVEKIWKDYQPHLDTY